MSRCLEKVLEARELAGRVLPADGPTPLDPPAPIILMEVDIMISIYFKFHKYQVIVIPTRVDLRTTTLEMDTAFTTGEPLSSISISSLTMTLQWLERHQVLGWPALHHPLQLQQGLL